jgi:hypothetical protein
VQAARPEELRKRLVVANGGAAELLPGGEPSPAELGREEGLIGSGEACGAGARKREVKGGAEGRVPRSSARR